MNRKIMLLNNVYIKFFSLCIIISFIVTLLLGAISFEDCNCDKHNTNTHNHVYQEHSLNERFVSARPPGDDAHPDPASKKRLAIIVPYRNRFEELLHFVPHMQKFLDKQHIPHRIFIVNQVDRYRFNRASLINVGFLYTKDAFDYIAMHDVDLLPMNDDLKYEYPLAGPFHVAAPNLHPKYHYATFVGGILLVARHHFEEMNGMSNRYWGWGLEDDEFYVRIKDAGLKVSRPKSITTGINDTFVHNHDRTVRKRDTAKCFNQKEMTRKRDRETGLNTLKYTIEEVKQLTIDSTPLTVLNVKLYCDRKETPWCDCNGT